MILHQMFVDIISQCMHVLGFCFCLGVGTWKWAICRDCIAQDGVGEVPESTGEFCIPGSHEWGPFDFVEEIRPGWEDWWFDCVVRRGRFEFFQ